MNPNPFFYILLTKSPLSKIHKKFYFLLIQLKSHGQQKAKVLGR